MTSPHVPSAPVDRRAVAGTVAMLAVLLFLQTLPQGPGVQRASDLLQVALAAAATAAGAVAAVRGHGKARLFWSMVAVSTAVWSAGQLFFTIEHSALAPASASALQRGFFFFAAFPLAVAGLIRPDRPGASRLLVVLDVALLAGLVLFIYFYVGALSQPGPGFDAWRQVATLCQTLVIVLTVMPLTCVRRSPWTTAYRHVAAAGLLWFAGNAVLAAAFFRGFYRAGLWDVPWTVPFVWLAAAAVAWRPAVGGDTLEDGAPRQLSGQPWKDTRRGLAVALGAVGMVPTLHLVTTLLVPMDAALWQVRTAMAFGALATLGVLFAVRQLLVVRGAEAEERERARELERTDARFQQAFRDSPAAMAIVRDDDLRVVDVNQRCCDLLDLPRPQIIGAPTTELLIRMPDAGHESLESMIAAGRTRTAQPLRFHTRAGAPVDSLVSLERIEVDGRPAALLLMEDVRQRKGLEEQLVNAQKMDAIGRLAGGIAHEFNNLLTAIINAGALAQSEVDRPAAVQGHLDRIDGASRRAASLTRQLLAFGRRQALRPEIIDLAGVVDEMQTLLPSVLGEDIHLTIARATRLPPVRADRSQLRQVVLNLAANARDAMPRGGRLSITLSEEAGGDSRGGRGVVMSVADDGRGMSEQVKQHLFEPFFTTKERAEGGGLGLAAVYGIVTQSGGHIAVDSAPGRGTTIRISLPAAAPEAGHDRSAAG